PETSGISPNPLVKTFSAVPPILPAALLLEEGAVGASATGCVYPLLIWPAPGTAPRTLWKTLAAGFETVVPAGSVTWFTVSAICFTPCGVLDTRFGGGTVALLTWLVGDRLGFAVFETPVAGRDAVEVVRGARVCESAVLTLAAVPGRWATLNTWEPVPVDVAC